VSEREKERERAKGRERERTKQDTAIVRRIKRKQCLQ
jgi:hypothetical protein